MPSFHFIAILSPVHRLTRVFQRRPKTCLLAGVVLLIAVLGAGYFWLYYQLWAAQRAFRLDLLLDARRHFDSYLRFQPDDVEAHLLASRVNRLLGMIPGAESHLNECKRIEGMSDRIQMEWLFIRAEGGELRSVEPGLLYSLTKEEDLAQSRLILEALALGYLKELRFKAALGCLNRWLKEEDLSVRAHYLRGWVLENLENSEGAKDDYKRVMALCPQHTNARLRLAQISLNEKDLSEAARHLRVLQLTDMDKSEVAFSLGCLRTLQGKLDEARELFERLAVREPNNSRAFYRLGQLAVTGTEKEKWFRKALEVDPSYHEARYALYGCLLQQPNRNREAVAEKNKYEETLKSWENLKGYLVALERTPHNPDLLAKIGTLLLDRDPMAGEDFLRKALEIAPDHPMALKALTQHEKTERCRKAPLVSRIRVN